jgi:hypothetical protein
MSQAVEELKSGQSLPADRKRESLPVPREHGLEIASRSKRAETDIATQVEHPSDRKARLKEQGENGKLHRRRQMVCTIAFLIMAFGLCFVWGFVTLSGRFSPEEKQQMNSLMKDVVSWVACFGAGSSYKKWLGS